MLFSWMKSIIMYLILSGIAINLSPGKKYKRYISFFSGLVVIVILAEPITYIFGVARGDVGFFAEDVDKYLMHNYSMNDNGNIYDYYDMSLECSVEYFLKDRGIKAEKISVITDENNNLKKIYIYMGNKSYDEKREQSISNEQIKKYLQEVYNLDFDSIYIVRR